MIQKSVTIINKLGLHARASAKLVACAARFASVIEISYEDNLVNAKSIMGVMMLGANKGNTLELSINGEDETEAAEALENLFADRFGEKE